ncbi:uncharacterized protein DNG_10460 [Cephalotrichum gorgonifer]|uniref:Acriflavine sensitivity control protein acr-2 n=1 Tax=Cephalotrichum gorgonifer TaxID=2041049 RepID=A0AAE8N9I6_9PEZI|nr:uncharacterized protein DNG_10460 [Cephalotrichum gorgonifer]
MFLVSSVKNPYSQVISMIGSSPALVNAVLALAACHCAHSATGFPLYTFRRGRVQPLAPQKQILFPTTSNHTSGVSQSDLLNQYLILKHNALRHLSEALADSDDRYQSGTLATILLLALLELLESGAGFWNVHIEGAKTLLEDGAKYGIDSHAPLIKAMIDELILSRLECDAGGEVDGIAGVGCPTVIIMAIDLVSSQRRASIEAVLENSDLPIQSLYSTLRQIQTFDIHSWATSVVACPSLKITSISPKDLAHVGAIWKLAAEIYVSRLLYNLVEDADLLLPLVDVLRYEYSALGAEHCLVNGLAWPTFIAGASSSTSEQRVWALEVLERIWEGTMCANVKNAPLVLERLWKKQDIAREKSGCNDPGAWDWITELSSLEDRWIFL